MTGVVTSTTKTIAEAIFAIMKDMPSLNKGERNEYAKYNYVSIDRYYEEIRTLAFTHGLVWNLRQIEAPVVLETKSKDGAMLFNYAVDLIHASGAEIKAFSALSIPHPIQGPQTAGSAMSYADKLFMRQLFKIPTGEYDADAVDPQALQPNVVPIRPVRVPAEAQKREAALDASFPPLNQEAGGGTPAPDGTLAAAASVASPVPASPEGEIGGKELLDLIDPDGTLAPKYDHDYGIPILATIEPTRAIDHNWDGVVRIFEEFVPRLQTKKAIRQLWEKNEGTLRQLKIVQPGMYKSIMGWIKRRDAQLTE